MCIIDARLPKMGVDSEDFWNGCTSLRLWRVDRALVGRVEAQSNCGESDLWGTKAGIRNSGRCIDNREE